MTLALAVLLCVLSSVGYAGGVAFGVSSALAQVVLLTRARAAGVTVGR